MKVYNCHTSSSIFDTNEYYLKSEVDEAIKAIKAITEQAAKEGSGE